MGFLSKLIHNHEKDMKYTDNVTHYEKQSMTFRERNRTSFMPGQDTNYELLNAKKKHPALYFNVSIIH